MVEGARGDVSGEKRERGLVGSVIYAREGRSWARRRPIVPATWGGGERGADSKSNPAVAGYERKREERASG